MVGGLFNKLASKSLKVAGKWQQQQLRRLNIHEYQGAELMSKFGINVPKGVAVCSVEEVRKAIQTTFPNEKELVVKSQILAGGRGLGKFTSGLQGGVHIVKAEQEEEIAVFFLQTVEVWSTSSPADVCRCGLQQKRFSCRKNKQHLRNTFPPTTR